MAGGLAKSVTRKAGILAAAALCAGFWAGIIWALDLMGRG
jgi:hypothetical protein